MQKNKNIFYISDFSLPNMSAYALHVLKMCDAFSERNYKVNLLIPNIKKDYNFKKIKREYLLKFSFKIHSFFRLKLKRNFITLILFSFKLLKFFKNHKKPDLIISRSILPAFLLSLFGINIFLEIHTEPRGITKKIFNILRYFDFNNKIKFILIHRNLNKTLKLKKNLFIILDDCVDIRDFKKISNKKNNCLYTGSFVKGKGIETIISIASLLPHVRFFLYGNKKTLNNHLHKKIVNQKNIFLNDFASYNRISTILPRSKILLMPYEEKVGVLIKNLDVSNYISPLKLFDYLASGSTIIASNKKAYDHILKHKFNCFLINSSKNKEWAKIIDLILSKKLNTKTIQKNSIKTAKKYSWLKRVEAINKFNT